MLSKEHLRQRVIRRFAKVRRGMQQLIRDVQWWNENRTDALPMDCEAEQVYLAAVAELPDDPSTWDADQQKRHTQATNDFAEAIKPDP